MPPLRVLVILLFFELVACSRILILPVPFQSDIDEAIALAQALRDERFHKPVIVVPARFPRQHRFEHLGLETLTYAMPDKELVIGTVEYRRHIKDKVFDPDVTDAVTMKTVAGIINYHCIYMMQDEVFMETLTQGGFEFALVDGYAWNPCMAALHWKLLIPFAVWSSTLHPYHIHVTFDATVPAFGAQIRHDMSSSERFWNMWYYYTGTDISPDPFLLESLPYTVKSWRMLLRKARLFIGSVDDSLSWYSKPLQGYLRVPGLTTGKPKELNETLAEIVATKSKGSDILLSFGEAFREIPGEMMRKLLLALDNTQKLVLTDLHTPSKKIQPPANVHFVRSVPLNDLLAHSTFRVLICACDNDKVHQALYHGVSVLCFPMLGEQYHTAFRLADRELGLSLDFQTFTAQEFYQALGILLRGGSGEIRENVRRLASYLQKRKTKPVTEVANEIDTVIKVGKNYKVVAASRPLWTIFIIEWVLIGALLLALIRLIFWCRQICVDDDVEEVVDQKDRKRKAQKVESKKTK